MFDIKFHDPLRQLAHDLFDQIEVEKKQLLTQAREIGDHTLKVKRAQSAFQAQKGKIAKLEQQLRALDDHTTPAVEHRHAETASAWEAANPETQVKLFRDGYGAKVLIAGREVGSVVTRRPEADKSIEVHHFAPLRCVEQVAIGPFDSFREALDAALTVTPYNPDHPEVALGAEALGITGVPLMFGEQALFVKDHQALNAQREARVEQRNALDMKRAAYEADRKASNFKTATSVLDYQDPDKARRLEYEAQSDRPSIEGYHQWLDAKFRQALAEQRSAEDAKIRAGLAELDAGLGLPGDVVEAKFAERRGEVSA